jgi:hypothetical protein
MRNKLFFLFILVIQTVYSNAQNQPDKNINQSPKSDKLDLEKEMRELQKDLILDDIKSISKDEAVALELLEELKTIPNSNKRDIQRTELELESCTLRKELKNMQLEIIDSKISGKNLTEARESEILNRKKEINDRLTDIEKNDKALAEDELLDNGSEWELKAKRAELIAKLKLAESRLNIGGSSMKPTQRYALEKEIKALKTRIEALDKKLDEK